MSSKEKDTDALRGSEDKKSEQKSSARNQPGGSQAGLEQGREGGSRRANKDFFARIKTMLEDRNSRAKAATASVENGKTGEAETRDEKKQGNGTEWILSNQILHSVKISPKQDSLPPKIIPPFGKLQLSIEELEEYDVDEWVSMGVLEKRAKERSRTGLLEALGIIWGAAALYGGLVWGVWRAVDGIRGATSLPGDYWLWIGYIALTGTVIALIYFSFKRGAIRSLAQSLKHGIGGVLQLAIAFGIPSLVIGMAQLTQIPSDSEQGTMTFSFFGLTSISFNAAYVGPAIQVLMVGIMSGLPALLFYLFDRHKLSILKEEFFRSIVMLAPSIHTLREAESIYGLRAQATLGSTSSKGRGSRFLPHNRSIIFVTTTIVAVGWTLTLADQPISPGSALGDYFVPTASSLAYAFLGAYTFGIGMLYRRYARSDIKPSAYAHFTTRMITSVIIAWTITLILPSGTPVEASLVLAFVVGFFPDTGLAAIFEFVKRRKFIRTNIPSLSEKFPLELLDGINIYHRVRLVDEGIENLENLAHADLVELMLQTRIPLATLIDWIDQSILYLHLAAERSQLEKDLQNLRGYGVRTASDLERIVKKRKGEDQARFLRVLNPDGNVPRVRAILDSLEDDEWWLSIKEWRKARDGKIKSEPLEVFI